jgi:hypothetical protein
MAGLPASDLNTYLAGVTGPPPNEALPIFHVCMMIYAGTILIAAMI